MECPRRWTVTCLLYFILLDVSIFCQNVPSEIVSRSMYPGSMSDINSNKEFLSTLSSTSSKSQLINTLLSMASNGALPERAGTIVQSVVQPEKPVSSGILEERPETLNILSLQPYNFNEPIVVNSASKPGILEDRSQSYNIIPLQPTYNSRESILLSQPSILPNQSPNILVNPPFLTAPYVAPSLQTTSISTPISLNSFLMPPQAVPVQTSSNIIQNIPNAWQIPQSLNDGYKYISTNPFTYQTSIPSVNWQVSPPCSILPEINTNSDILEFLSGPNLETIIQEPTLISNEYDSGIPINLQINVPSQTAPAPRITIVSASPQVVETAKVEQNPGDFPPFGIFPPPPPLIKRRSRSSWKTILPIVLLTLFNDRGCYGGCGGCPCCNCNCNIDSPIPMPYPIPIPVNNPIINNSRSSCTSRNREQRDHEDEKTK